MPEPISHAEMIAAVTTRIEHLESAASLVHRALQPAWEDDVGLPVWRAIRDHLEWRPIDTLPEDRDVDVWLYLGNSSAVTVQWRCGPNSRIQARLAGATRWMLLPPSPESTDA